MFKRRDTRNWARAVAEFFYPRGGWWRAVSYILYRLRRLPDPPHRIARGVAAGVFVCFTPYFGFHFVLAAVLAVLMQGNIVAALLATFFGNPLTFPLIAVVSMETGHLLLGTPPAGPPHVVFAEFAQASAELWHNVVAIFGNDVAHWDRLTNFFWRVLWPYTIGGIIPGIVAGVVAYMITLPAVEAYQRRRVAKLKARYEARRRAIEAAEAAETEADTAGDGKESVPADTRREAS